MSESPDQHLSGIPLPALAAAITSGAVRVAAATAAWLRMIAEFDEREGWHCPGVLSCAHWLAWQCGMSPGAAREHVRTARALQSLPLIDAAFTDGRLSYSKVRALTRVAEPDTESSLLEVALEMTASQLERTVRQWRRADRLASGEPPAEERQAFHYWWDETGMLTVRLRLPTDEGAAFISAIESQVERAARRERAQEKRARSARGAPQPEDDGLRTARERTTARRIAALATLAEAGVHVDRRAGDPPRREVVVHVDAAVVADDAAAGRAYVEGGPALSGATVRRMLCEATVVTMLERNREPLAVGRRKRCATKAQVGALMRRDGGCARPGCPEARIERLHAHHMRHWLFGGPTDLANLVLLCDRDHGLVHELDLVMARRDRVLVVTDRDGRRVWGPADAAFTTGLAGLEVERSPDDDPFVGVQPLDTAIGRRPRPASRSARSGRAPAGRSDRVTRPRNGHRDRDAAALIGSLVFPGGEPPLPDAMQANGERADIRFVVGVLMGNRDLVRRLAAENGGVPAGTS